MIVRVVGFEHLSGVSKKSGNPYDFYKVYGITSPERRPSSLMGDISFDFTVSPASVDACGGLRPGECYEYHPGDRFSPASLIPFKE